MEEIADSLDTRFHVDSTCHQDVGLVCLPFARLDDSIGITIRIMR
jgi:hypothetical protein